MSREEIKNVYEDIIINWFNIIAKANMLTDMLKCLTDGKIEEFSNKFKSVVENSFSYFDVTKEEPERFYHGFI